MYSFNDNGEDVHKLDENENCFQTIHNPMEDESFDYEAWEEVYDTFDSMSAPFQTESDSKCNYKRDLTKKYASPTPLNAAQR